jgi:hypothetical protein
MTWVQDGIFAAGGDALPSDWAAFAAQTGITAILHLRPVAPATFLGPAPESYLWMDLADETQAGLGERLLAGSFVEDCLARGQRVLLHASLGRHRTRWAFVAYRICSGAAPRAARRQAAEPPWLAPYATDESSWDRLAEAVHRSRVDDGRAPGVDRP